MTSTETVADATTPPEPERTQSAAAQSEASQSATSQSATSQSAAPTNAVEGAPAHSEAAQIKPAYTPDNFRSNVLSSSERRRRTIGATVWVLAFLIGWLTIGIPTDPVEAFFWIWTATIAWNNFRPARTHLIFLRDWAPLVILLVAYNISRGWADDTTPHAAAMVHADEHMWGWLTGGTVPTIWLQHHLYNPVHIQWYDVLASFTYFSHFVTALTIAAVLWMRNRGLWARFTRRWFALTALGLATYYLYPAAPPWWAAQPQHGPLIGPVVRISTRGWDAIGLHHAGSVLSAAQVQSANDVAAMPSLHSATAMLVVAFFLPMVRKRWWPLLLAYPVVMTFTLVYSGEHYMIDVIFGWIYVAGTFLLVSLAERLWARYRARKRTSGERGDLAQESSDLEKV